MNSVFEVAELIRRMGRIEGRKRLQKIVYLLQQSGFPFREAFEYGHYGPYSTELADELEMLEMNELVRASTTATMAGDCYVYEPTQKLMSAIEQAPGLADLHESQNIDGYLAIITPEITPTLEVASSIVFLANLGYTGEKLQNKLQSWKPHLMSFETNARQLLGQLGLRQANA